MTNVIVSFFTHFKGFLDTILPTMNSSGIANVTTAITYFINLISAADYFFPVTTLFEVIGLIMGYKIGMFLWFCINWVLRFIVV